MKLTIKTLDQKTVQFDFDDEKTVWDLKTHLFSLPEIAVKPDVQQIIYAGRILENNDPLALYSIDERKFLVVMSKRTPPKAEGNGTIKEAGKDKPKLEKDSKVLKSNRVMNKENTSIPVKVEENTPTDAPPPAEASIGQERHLLNGIDQAPTTTVSNEMVQSIMSMGYAEADVRRALAASYNNADRAINYLIDGIPELPEFTDIGQINQTSPPTLSSNINPLQHLRSDPRFEQMRTIITAHPEMLSSVLAKIGETNPGLLSTIRQHQDEFVRMINDTRPPNEDHEAIPAVVNVELSVNDESAIQRLMDLGFEREIVIQTYFACDKNEEQTADLLFRQMED